MTGALEDISEEKLQDVVQAAVAKMETSAADMTEAEAEYEFAKCEVSGAESGDGRDEKNRSLPERLRDLESEIVCSPMLKPNVCGFVTVFYFRCATAVIVTRVMQTQQEAEVDRAQLAMTHLQKQLKAAVIDSNKKLQEDAKLNIELEGARQAVEVAKQAVDAVPIDLAEVTRLEQASLREQTAVTAYHGKCRTIACGIGHMLNFAYNDPWPGFDRRSVKGVLARLVQLKETTHATALEVAAGPKLSHVVVDTDQVGVFNHVLKAFPS